MGKELGSSFDAITTTDHWQEKTVQQSKSVGIDESSPPDLFIHQVCFYPNAINPVLQKARRGLLTVIANRLQGHS